MDDQATAAHSSEAVERPCERFGREYALKNAIARLSQTNLPTLYDDLKMKLRALDSLGRKSRKIRGCILFVLALESVRTKFYRKVDLNAFHNCIDEFRPTCSNEYLPRLFYAVLQTSTVRFPALTKAAIKKRN
ncbi:hypothetical protein CDAR_562661 [Caerostris darwini]|uniref:Uncharacterized protein n=1 Tax=Caerostris darwini TaxID=1538125 RepID=A0AAV4X9K2_9ARAC|nr:hypothetical protein CDAR_562661 [Caerostris darwini]